MAGLLAGGGGRERGTNEYDVLSCCLDRCMERDRRYLIQRHLPLWGALVVVGGRWSGLFSSKQAKIRLSFFDHDGRCGIGDPDEMHI